MSQGESALPNSQPSGPARWLREPLLHFLLIGAALFAVYYARHPEALEVDDTNRIELTSDDLRRLEAAWTVQWQRAPTPSERQRMVDNWVREEILYREALALGLDRDDALVRKRMAQKMDFLAEDVADLREPSPEELEAWFKANADRFAGPPKVTYRQVFFANDMRGDRARADAEQTLAQLANEPANSTTAIFAGDPFEYESNYSDRSPDEVGSVFGRAFADELFKLDAGAWRGPLQSGLGWHIVYVESLAPGPVPALDDVREQVLEEWAAERRARIKRDAFEKLRERYEIIVPSEVAAGADSR